MGKPQKYLFDVSFDHVDLREEPEAPSPPPPPPPEETFTRAQLDAAREAGVAEGRNAGLAEAAAAVATRTTAVLETIARGLVGIFVARDAMIKETHGQAVAALRLIVSKALPALAAKAPLAEIEAVTSRCLMDAIDEPRVVLRVGNDLYEPVRGQLDALIAASGYPGRIVLLADENLSGGDARVEWADGGVERRLDEQLGEIDAAIARTFSPAPAGDTASP